MARRKFVLPPDVRDALILAADGRAQALLAEDPDLDASDAAELVGEAVEFGLEVLGMSDRTADKVGDMAKGLVTRLEKALKPDPNKLLAEASKAMKAGKRDKARRLFDRAAKVFERQEKKKAE